MTIITWLYFAFFIYLLFTFFYVGNDFSKSDISEFIDQYKKAVWFFILATFCFFLLPLVVNAKRAVMHIAFCLKDYLYYLPSYFHIILYYAYCNMNDFSWYQKFFVYKDY